jgi:hypothetical protein
MDQKLVIHFEIKRDERTYVLELPAGCPTGEAYDVVHEMLQEILKIAQNNAKSAAESKPITPEVQS